MIGSVERAELQFSNKAILSPNVGSTFAGHQPPWPARKLSRRGLVAIWNTFGYVPHNSLRDALYANNFPDWFVTHAQTFQDFDWAAIIRALRSRQFFYPSNSYFSDSRSNITGRFLDQQDADGFGESLIQGLAALAIVLAPPERADTLRRQLELEGFQIDLRNLRLVPLEGPVSETQEEELLTRLIRQVGPPNAATILRHITAARDQYLVGNNHECLNESRSFFQALMDDISTETGRAGGHAISVPGGTANRIGYLEDVGFLTTDERCAFSSAWAILSAGSHPGVPAREEARIGLILALELGQLLALKFDNWRQNQYRAFSSP